MLRNTRSLLLVLFAAVLLAACSKLPDNARYIPDDAISAAGINLKSLSKKIAWNLITGSKLYKEMQKRMPAEGGANAMKGIENAGIDVLNTFYIYARADTRFEGGNVVVALAPLANVASWEQYVKQVFPEAKVKQLADRKEATLGSGMYVGWNSNLLIIINGTVDDDEENSEMQIAAEMQRAFLVPATNPLVNNTRYAALEKHGYDLSFWLDYGSVITEMSENLSGSVNGVSLSPAAWKNAILTAGINFKKGQITGDINNYLPSMVEEATKSFGTVKTDKELLDRLPKNDLDMLLAMHISPGGVKAILEKAGLFGPTNMGLATQGLELDAVLGAFSGDMAIVMNDMSLKAVAKKDIFMGQMVTHTKQNATMSMTYALKIDNYDNFSRLLELTAEGGGMKKIKNGYVQPLTANDTLYIMMDKQYAIASNRREYAEGFLDGRFRKNTLPAISKAYSTPFAMYLDIQKMLKNVDPAISSSTKDSTLIAESKKLLDNISIHGGNFTEEAYKFKIDINFLDKNENSILELIDFGMRMNDIRNMPDM